MSNTTGLGTSAVGAMRPYQRRSTISRVWTKDFNGRVSTITGWMPRQECKNYILGRWGHWPPWAFISTCATEESFRIYNGD